MPSTVRDRVRAELTAEITAVARRQLAEVGAAGLSLRAVAREVGMASSAVYRYFASRDELLTRLITDGYDALGAAAARQHPDPVSPCGEQLGRRRPDRSLAHDHVQCHDPSSGCRREHRSRLRTTLTLVRQSVKSSALVCVHRSQKGGWPACRPPSVTASAPS